MLIAFKSKSSPEVLMYQEHAQRILDLLHKNPTRGVITAAEAEQALSVLEHEVAETKPVSYTHLTLPTICSV